MRSAESTHQSFLDDRYGTHKKGGWKLPAIILLVVATPWLLWSGSHYLSPEITWELISFSDDQSPAAAQATPSITVTYRIQRRTPEKNISCTLVARDIDKNVVGELTDLIIGGKERSILRKVAIKTRVPAVNGAVERCYLAR